MATLTRELRRSLENTVREARRIAETGARKVIEQLAVHHHEPWSSMTPEQRELRNALRAHGRQLGDRRDERRGLQAIDRLTTECAYEHWHRMLFARFLAETNLLIEPESGMDITLDDCRELARERGEDWLELASSFAERMLPEIFRTGDPVLKVALPPETRSDLENLLKDLPRDVFIADDSLGWVYQYWQADRKDEINHSEKKIGADELPAVTQLFTEDYMVFFLLHNTLGAWWAGRVLAARPELATSATTEDELRVACAMEGIEWTYLRFVRDADGSWRPAAGTFEGWPKAPKEITVLDPSMGSGHFLVFSLPILVAFRMAEEELTQEDAVDAVLRDNLFGLEIDPRCTQIAAFNLALAAWRAVGHRPLPRPHLACSGLSLGVSKTEWNRLAERAAESSPVPPERDLLGSKDNLFSARIKTGLERLYDLFGQAPTLGSLINPSDVRGDMFSAEFAQLEPMLREILVTTHTDELAEMAVAAQGMAKAAEILAKQFTLVATNVPYLGRGKQDDLLKDYCERHHPNAKTDLATCFVERCLDFCRQGNSAALVTPQSWLFQSTYRNLRQRLFKEVKLNSVARLGPRAFETISGEVVNVGLITFTNELPGVGHKFFGLDVIQEETPAAKGMAIRIKAGVEPSQSAQVANPDSKLLLEDTDPRKLLSSHASSYQGIKTGDDGRVRRFFWELPRILPRWRFFQSTVEVTKPYGGLEGVIDWIDDGKGLARRQGLTAWEHKGIMVSQMGQLPVALYLGEAFDSNASPIIPNSSAELSAIWMFCSSDEYLRSVRQVDQSLKPTNTSLVQVSFDVARWQRLAEEKFPNGLPQPQSDDCTQWIFHGDPKSADCSLQVAVARLVGYRWPRQTGSTFLDCSTLSKDALEGRASADGIVCFPSLRGDRAAVDRLLDLLGDAFGSDWSAAKLRNLLADVGFGGASLEAWLHDGFFAQHCELFHQRPFVWHVWDGRRDGFHALVNYHKLAGPSGEGKRTLESLIYAYLGDWIDRQRSDQKAGLEGADGRLIASEHLKNELEKILSGEPPYDLFVRWKPVPDQPIGWEPDINDGVRMNIRPFMTAKPLGARARGTCILRATPLIKWDKDRGKEPQRSREEFPWFWGWDEQATDFTGSKTFDGNRWNELHYSRSFKEAARERSKK